MAKIRTHTMEPHKSKDGANYLFTSLYLVVLAFFILLNSLSKIEEKKSSEAIKSVSESFSDTTIKEQMPYLENPDESGETYGGVGSERAVTSFFAPVGELAKEMLSITGGEVIEKGNVMIITVPEINFFLANRIDIRPTQRAFLDRMANEVTKITGAERVDIYFLHEVANNRFTQKEGEVFIPIARTGLVARELEKMGVPAEAIHAGIHDKQDGNVTFMFARRVQAKAEVKQ